MIIALAVSSSLIRWAKRCSNAAIKLTIAYQQVPV